MRRAHTVDQVRAAETALMATLPPGTLMQRAATGLAYAVIDYLGGAYGKRVVVLVGSGDNGGDALYAGAFLARRGAHVTAWLLSERAHEAGCAALRAAGGRVVGFETVAARPPQPPGVVAARPPQPSTVVEEGALAPVSKPQARGFETVAARPPQPPTVVEEGALAPVSKPQARGFETVAARPDVVIDGIVGIGGQPGLRPAAVAALEALAGVPVVAVDVPSGVGVDTGELDGPHVSADLTVTFGTHKVCHLVDPAATACGVVQLVDIGLDLPAPSVEALQADDVARMLPSPPPSGHKYSRGVVGVRAGSAEYPGAALLAVAGAATGLVGMVRYVGAAEETVKAQFPETVGAGQAQAWVVGSGGGEEAEQQLAAALADGVPVVVDASALPHVRPGVSTPLVLTPHAGELAAMLGVDRVQVEAAPLAHARRAARELGHVVLLKGRRSVVAAPDGPTRVNTTGTPWLATAGAGDVLAGLIGALLARGLTPFDAAAVGAWLHGAAATLASAEGPIVARDVAHAVPATMRLLHS